MTKWELVRKKIFRAVGLVVVEDLLLHFAPYLNNRKGQTQKKRGRP